MDTGHDDLIKAYRAIITGPSKAWVLFDYGTCVVLPHPEPDRAAQATAILREWGPAHAGTPGGDFDMVALDSYPGWVVGCHHPDILNYVAPREDDGEGSGDLMVGLIGRARRDADAHELKVVHIEEREPGTPYCSDMV
jgi:hypothetical protein